MSPKRTLPNIKKDPRGYEKIKSTTLSAADELRITLGELAVAQARMPKSKRVS